MTTLYLVLPLALVIATISVLAFAWSVHTGQLDDLDTPAQRVLLDDADHARFARVAMPPAKRAPGELAIEQQPTDSQVS